MEINPRNNPSTFHINIHFWMNIATTILFGIVWWRIKYLNRPSIIAVVIFISNNGRFTFYWIHDMSPAFLNMLLDFGAHLVTFLEFPE